VRRLATDHTPETDDRLELPGFRGTARCLRELEGARHHVDSNVVRGSAGFDQRGTGALHQSAGDGLVEARRDQREARAARRAQRHRNIDVTQLMSP
jgi:hypothetical protein